MNKTKRFNVLLSPQQWDELSALAAQKSRSAADLMREAVAALLDTELRHQPRCANGMNCLAGHLHPAAMMHPQNPLAQYAMLHPAPGATPRLHPQQQELPNGTGTHG